MKNWQLIPVEKKIQINDFFIVLLKVDNTKLPPENGINNLIATYNEQEVFWIAELPKNSIFEYYVRIEFLDGKMFAWTANSLLCEIDVYNGKILSCEFIK